MTGRLLLDDLRLPMNLFAMKTSTLRKGILLIFSKSRNITVVLTWLRPRIFLALAIVFSGIVSAQLNRQPIVPGAERVSLYVPSLKNKKVGVVANHASLINGRHLVDSLISSEVNIVRILVLNMDSEERRMLGNT